MDFSKFTERARGFIQAAQTIAIRENHQRILPEHILKANDMGICNFLKSAPCLQNAKETVLEWKSMFLMCLMFLGRIRIT